ncbi:MAG: hypothetical protein KJ930_06910, partial [Gammaproteobacteria bacterium]|nr:hypothetical protein [Gammaproteobacteria bacterium]
SRALINRFSIMSTFSEKRRLNRISGNISFWHKPAINAAVLKQRSQDVVGKLVLPAVGFSVDGCERPLISTKLRFESTKLL